MFAELAMKRTRRAAELVAEAIRVARVREPRAEITGTRWQQISRGHPVQRAAAFPGVPVSCSRTGGSRALAALASGRSATPTSGPADRGAGYGRLRERRTAAGDRSTLANPAAPAAYCLVTWMLVALVVSVYPAVWLVNDPLSEPNVKAV